MLCYDMLCYAMLYCAMLYYNAMLYYAMLYYTDIYPLLPQMLYLESLLRAAEIKFLVALGLVRAYLALVAEEGAGTGTGAGAGPPAGELVGLVCAALVNAAACRCARHLKVSRQPAPGKEGGAEVALGAGAVGSHSGSGSGSGSGSSWMVLPGRADLCSLSASGLVDTALGLVAACPPPAGPAQPRQLLLRTYSSIIMNIKKALILEKSKIFPESVAVFEGAERALVALAETLAKTPCDAGAGADTGADTSADAGAGAAGVGFVLQYPAGHILTQSFMSGAECCPVDHSGHDSSARTHTETLTETHTVTADTGVSLAELMQVQILDIRVKLAKLRQKI
jgi:hypothetical protein